MLKKMVTDITIGKAGELVLDTAIDKLTNYKDEKRWEKLFVDTNEFLLKRVERGDELLAEISEYLSCAEIKEIAHNLTLESKYELQEKLHIELTKLMMKYEIPANEANYYISGFVSVIFRELERVNPAFFQCAYLGDWRHKEETALQEVKKELSTINSIIEKMNNNNVSVYTTDQLEIKLYLSTKNPSLTLDFFEIDDDVFKEEFADSLDEESIYIKGQCKEESVFCVLNELRHIRPDKSVLVIKDAEDWEKLRKANEENEGLGRKILIPWFYEEQIISIPNNTNIFIFGSEEYPVGKHVIELRKRKRETVRKKLEDLGATYEDAFRLVEDTHGLYIPIKKKLINGIDTVIPNWLKANMKIVLPLLLCGKWEETDGDKMVIEDLCGTSYQEVLAQIHEYTNGENPLFVKFKNHGNTIFHLASTENAWGYLEDNVDFESELWEKYVGLISAIVAEEDPAYNFPIEQQAYANILPGGSSCWSTTIKEGLLSSLVMKAYFNNKLENQRIIDGVVLNVLDNVTTKKQWLSIAKLFPILCEASPYAIEKRLDAEWERDTGLKEVFLETNDLSFWAKNEYTNYIWGIEQFFCQREYVAWAIRWFFRISELRRKYPITNSPFDTLSKVFCSWFNVTVLTQDEKIQLAEEAFSKGYDVWDLFYLELPGITTTIMSSTSKPKYRMVSDPIELTNKDVWSAYTAYLDLCISNMDFMASRWEKIISHINHFDNTTIKKITERLRYELISMNDIEKVTIKEKIRDEIYRNRYYDSSEWAMKKSGTEILEALLNDIMLDDQVYEYRYLFKSKYDFPLMHPYPFSEDEKRELNKALMEKEISVGIKQFKERELDIMRLVEICSEYDYSSLGIYLFDLYSEKQFDEVLFGQMIVNEKLLGIVLDYVQAAYYFSRDNLQKAYYIAKNNKVSNETIMRILMIETIDVDKHLLIMEEDEAVKELYWKSFNRSIGIHNKETAHFVINEMLKYSNHMCIIETLDDCKEFFTAEEIISIFENIKNYEVGNATSMSGYHVEELLSLLQTAFSGTEESIRVALIELSYRGLIDVAKMKCFYECLKESPFLYLQLLAIIYKTDDGKRVEGVELNEKNVSSIFSLYYDLHFCPAEENGKIDAAKLNRWISDFEEGLKTNKQNRLFNMELGRLLASSPEGGDGYYPAEEIRSVIEDKYSESMENEYITVIYNSRGVYSPTGGNEERKLALRYKENAERIRVKSPKTAKIYDHLYERYMYEADSERERDEYAGV